MLLVLHTRGKYARLVWLTVSSINPPSLRTHLSDAGLDLWKISEPLSIDQEITALQHALSKRALHPALRIEKPLLLDRTLSRLPVISNVFASRSTVARTLGISDHRQVARSFSSLMENPIPPVIVAAEEAPVQEVVLTGDAIDLHQLPFLRQHRLDVGPYITAGHCVTRDPDSGVDNTSIQRCWVRKPRETSFYPYPSSHNARNVAAYWAKNEACPIAIWIGHHPSIVIGANAKLNYPHSHWAAAGAFAGAPVRLTPTKTHGKNIMVPADAEIVIEGWVPAHRQDVDGPFAEYAGYTGPQVLCPMIEVSCVTMRSDALYHDIGAGLEDHLIPENMAMESKIYSMARAVAPSLRNVHVPFSGRRFHAYLQFENPHRGEVRDALMAVLAYRRVRTAIAVDEDIDIFDDREVMWAIATRVQWHRDQFSVDGLSHGNLDPSLPVSATTVTKLAIDASLPPSASPGLPKPFAPVNVVSQAAAIVGERLVEERYS